jgi:hypothetical protein
MIYTHTLARGPAACSQSGGWAVRMWPVVDQHNMTDETTNAEIHR